MKTRGNRSSCTACLTRVASLYYTMLYHTLPYYAIPYYTTLYYTVLYYTIPYYTIPFHTILHYYIQYARHDLHGRRLRGGASEHDLLPPGVVLSLTCIIIIVISISSSSRAQQQRTTISVSISPLSKQTRATRTWWVEGGKQATGV